MNVERLEKESELRPRSKRILILIKGLGRGGAEQLLASAAPYLDCSTYDYEVAYLLPHKDALVEEIKASGLPVYCIGGGGRFAWLGRLRKLAAERHIDLVHCHSPLAAVGARMALGGGMRRVYTEHNVWPRYHPMTYWANLLTFPRSDHVLAVSEHVKTSIRYPRFLAWRRIPPVETLYHGLDPKAVESWGGREDARKEFDIPQDAPLVGTVANFKTHKGYPYLVQAARLVRDSIPNVRFLLIGQGQLEDEIKAQVRSEGLEHCVTFAGFRTDVPRLVASLDLFLLSSLHEGLSIALIEAMALEKAVVVTDVGGIPEVMTHRKHGLVVPPRDPRALADATITLLADDALRATMGKAAAIRAQDFDIRKSVARAEEIYKGLLG